MNDVDRLSFFTMLFKSDNISQFDVLYKTFLISDNSIQLLLLSVLIFNYYIRSII